MYTEYLCSDAKRDDYYPVKYVYYYTVLSLVRKYVNEKTLVRKSRLLYDGYKCLRCYNINVLLLSISSAL
jgi:hypothetical protein